MTDAVLRADLAIFGGGPAGITIARQLRGSGLDVALVEGGGLGPTEAGRDLYRGEMVTRYRGKADDDYLTTSRLRFLGGTSNHWAGWCRPLDRSDFEVRDWVPDSGWPFGRDTLDPYYRTAAELVGIEPPVDDLERWKTSERPPLDLPWPLRTSLFQYSTPPTRFGVAYRDELERADDVRLLLETSLTRLVAAEGGRQVRHAECVGPDGRRLQIRARGFVLAAGAIENARLLLISRLGNDRDLVGRYFMEHPDIMRAGRMTLGHAPAGIAFYGAPGRDEVLGSHTNGVLTLDPAFRRRQRLLNGCLRLWRWEDPRKDPLERSMVALASDLAEMAGLEPPEEPLSGSILAVGEQRPNPDSRVTLASETDALGMPRARLDWRLTDEDADSLRRTIDLVARALGGSHRGLVAIEMSRGRPWKNLRGGAHHMGTTRMHGRPDRGVVDADCRVHGLANLWVGGSSVFPTSGFANPTLTILALGARLADHLRAELGR